MLRSPEAGRPDVEDVPEGDARLRHYRHLPFAWRSMPGLIAVIPHVQIVANDCNGCSPVKSA